MLQRTMPTARAAARRVAYDEATEMVHVLGRTPGRRAAATIYVIEPHATAGGLRRRPPAVRAGGLGASTSTRPYPTDDRQQILAFDGAGEVASVEVGQHAFAWRAARASSPAR